MIDLISYLLDKVFGMTIIMFWLLSMNNNKDMLIAAVLIIFTYTRTAAVYSKKKGESA